MGQILWIKQPVQVELVKSCKKQCKADPTRMFCTGCGRTIKEITEYGKQKRSHEAATTRDSRKS